MKGIDFMNNHWKAFREFCMWLLSWSGDSTLNLTWDCEKATGSICISYTELNSHFDILLKIYQAYLFL